jgi:DNA primase
VLWEREIANKKIETPDAQASVEAKFNGIIRTIKDSNVHTAYLRTSRMALANLFWQVAKSKRTLPSKGVVRTEIKIEKDGQRHGLQKLLLGLLVHYPEFLDEKLEPVSHIKFSSPLEQFRIALYDLLIVHHSVSVQFIYARLTPAFYDVLQEIHGELKEGRPWGHRLFERFPILRLDPPSDFVRRCIDHFTNVLRVEQMSEEIRHLQSGSVDLSEDEVSDRFLELIRDFQVQRELINATDMALAEEAQEIKRVALGPAHYERIAA